MRLAAPGAGVVTLGMVASIAGLGGFLAANPPAGTAAAETGTPEIALQATTPEVATPVEVSRPESPRGDGTGAGSTPSSVELTPVPEQEESVQAPAANYSPPAWSAPSPAPAATKSRGS